MSIPGLDWRYRAACSAEDAALFFGAEGEEEDERQAREAKAGAICAGCAVRRECLSYAVTNGVKWGYWGQVGEDERARIRRNYLRHMRGYERGAA